MNMGKMQQLRTKTEFSPDNLMNICLPTYVSTRKDVNIQTIYIPDIDREKKRQKLDNKLDYEFPLRKDNKYVNQHALGFQNKNNIDLFKHYFRLYKSNKFLMKQLKKYKIEKLKSIEKLVEKNQQEMQIKKEQVIQQKFKIDIDDAQQDNENEQMPIKIKEFIIDKNLQEVGFYKNLISLYENTQELKMRKQHQLNQQQRGESLLQKLLKHQQNKVISITDINQDSILPQRETQEEQDIHSIEEIFINKIIEQIKQKGVQSLETEDYKDFNEIINRRDQQLKEMKKEVFLQKIIEIRKNQKKNNLQEQNLSSSELQISKNVNLNNYYSSDEIDYRDTFSPYQSNTKKKTTTSFKKRNQENNKNFLFEEDLAFNQKSIPSNTNVQQKNINFYKLHGSKGQPQSYNSDNYQELLQQTQTPEIKKKKNNGKSEVDNQQYTNQECKSTTENQTQSKLSKTQQTFFSNQGQTDQTKQLNRTNQLKSKIQNITNEQSDKTNKNQIETTYIKKKQMFISQDSTIQNDNQTEQQDQIKDLHKKIILQSDSENQNQQKFNIFSQTKEKSSKVSSSINLSHHSSKQQTQLKSSKFLQDVQNKYSGLKKSEKSLSSDRFNQKIQIKDKQFSPKNQISDDQNNKNLIMNSDQTTQKNDQKILNNDKKLMQNISNNQQQELQEKINNNNNNNNNKNQKQLLKEIILQNQEDPINIKIVKLKRQLIKEKNYSHLFTKLIHHNASQCFQEEKSRCLNKIQESEIFKFREKQFNDQMQMEFISSIQSIKQLEQDQMCFIKIIELVSKKSILEEFQWLVTVDLQPQEYPEVLNYLSEELSKQFEKSVKQLEETEKAKYKAKQQAEKELNQIREKELIDKKRKEEILKQSNQLDKNQNLQEQAYKPEQIKQSLNPFENLEIQGKQDHLNNINKQKIKKQQNQSQLQAQPLDSSTQEINNHQLLSSQEGFNDSKSKMSYAQSHQQLLLGSEEGNKPGTSRSQQNQRISRIQKTGTTFKKDNQKIQNSDSEREDKKNLQVVSKKVGYQIKEESDDEMMGFQEILQKQKQEYDVLFNEIKVKINSKDKNEKNSEQNNKSSNEYAAMMALQKKNKLEQQQRKIQQKQDKRQDPKEIQNDNKQQEQQISSNEILYDSDENNNQNTNNQELNKTQNTQIQMTSTEQQLFQNYKNQIHQKQLKVQENQFPQALQLEGKNQMVFEEKVQEKSNPQSQQHIKGSIKNIQQYHENIQQIQNNDNKSIKNLSGKSSTSILLQKDIEEKKSQKNEQSSRNSNSFSRSPKTLSSHKKFMKDEFFNNQENNQKNINLQMEGTQILVQVISETQQKNQQVEELQNFMNQEITMQQQQQNLQKQLKQNIIQEVDGEDQNLLSQQQQPANKKNEIETVNQYDLRFGTLNNINNEEQQQQLTKNSLESGRSQTQVIVSPRTSYQQQLELNKKKKEEIINKKKEEAQKLKTARDNDMKEIEKQKEIEHKNKFDKNSKTKISKSNLQIKQQKELDLEKLQIPDNQKFSESLLLLQQNKTSNDLGSLQNISQNLEEFNSEKKQESQSPHKTVNEIQKSSRTPKNNDVRQMSKKTSLVVDQQKKQLQIKQKKTEEIIQNTIQQQKKTEEQLKIQEELNKKKEKEKFHSLLEDMKKNNFQNDLEQNSKQSIRQLKVQINELQFFLEKNNVNDQQINMKMQAYKQRQEQLAGLMTNIYNTIGGELEFKPFCHEEIYEIFEPSKRIVQTTQADKRMKFGGNIFIPEKKSNAQFNQMASTEISEGSINQILKFSQINSNLLSALQRLKLFKEDTDFIQNLRNFINNDLSYVKQMSLDYNYEEYQQQYETFYQSKESNKSSNSINNSHFETQTNINQSQTQFEFWKQKLQKIKKQQPDKFRQTLEIGSQIKYDQNILRGLNNDIVERTNEKFMNKTLKNFLPKSVTNQQAKLTQIQNQLFQF